MDSENIETLSNSFFKVFNKKVDIDWSVIENFPQRISQIQINDPLTFEKIQYLDCEINIKYQV